MATMNSNNIDIFTCNMSAFQLMKFAKEIRKEEYNGIIKFLEDRPGATIDEISFGTGIEHDSIMGMLNSANIYGGFGKAVFNQNKALNKKKKRTVRKFREIDSNGNLLDNTLEITRTKMTYYIENKK